MLIRSPRLLQLVALLAACVSLEASAQAVFPLRITADGRRLEDAAGQPFRMHGDAAWSLMVQLDLTEAELYLYYRGALAMNTILVNLIERGFGGPENQDGELPFVPADDFTSPNEAYFAHADQVLDLAAEKHMLVLLTPAYLGSACGSQGWCDQMLDQSVEDMRTYGRYLGARYADRKNIIWVHGGDTSALGQGALDHVSAIAEGIQEMAPAHLHTAHCSRNRSAVDCYDLPWLDLNNTYSACESSLEALQDDFDEVPFKPFFYIEGKYENEGASLDCLVEQHVWPLLSGAIGHVYGNNPIWRFGPDWQDELLSTGSLAMLHVSRLFGSRAWTRFEPDRSGEVLVAGGGSEAAAARTRDGETAMVYVPSATTVSVDLSSVSGTSAHGWWFDSKTGVTSDLGSFPTSGVVDFTSAGPRVLVLDDEASGLLPPGSWPYAFPSTVPAVGGLLVGATAALLALSARRGLRLRGRPPSAGNL